MLDPQLTDPHRLAEERSLAYHELVGERLLVERSDQANCAPPSDAVRAIDPRTRWRIWRTVRGALGRAMKRRDLVLSKLVAGPEKDIAFAKETARHKLVSVTTLQERLRATPVRAELLPHVQHRIAQLATSS